MSDMTPEEFHVAHLLVERLTEILDNDLPVEELPFDSLTPEHKVAVIQTIAQALENDDDSDEPFHVHIVLGNQLYVVTPPTEADFERMKVRLKDLLPPTT